MLGTTVAPLAGAWIEITASGIIDQILHVAPLAGAWIEMFRIASIKVHPRCRTPRGCVD